MRSSFINSFFVLLVYADTDASHEQNKVHFYLRLQFTFKINESYYCGYYFVQHIHAPYILFHWSFVELLLINCLLLSLSIYFFIAVELCSHSACSNHALLRYRTMQIFSLHWNEIPSVLWHCWLGGRKGIRPIKNWVVGCWHGYLSGARCRLAYSPAVATATHCLLLQ